MKPGNYLEKIEENNKKMAIEFYNLLIVLINEEFFLHFQLLESLNKEIAAKELEGKEVVEKNINHAMTLLAAAKESINKEGRTLFSDYLTTSALSHVAKYLPETSVANIITKLDKLDKSNNNSHHANTDKNFNRLVSRVNQTLKPLKPSINYNKQIVIDFAADQLPFREYGVSRARRLGASLLQVHPHKFSASQLNFSITENTNLTLIGHCASGLDYLSDNAGNIIYAAQIAQQIYSKMLKMGTSLDTNFTIDLIACRAASPYKGNPSFAERLVEELSNRGINNVRVIASPTVMTTTPDGNQANLTREEDRKRMRDRAQHDVAGMANNFFSSFGTLFSNISPPKLNVEKVTFQAKKQR